MCAIIDACVTFEVFGKKQTKAGIKFKDWLDRNNGILVVGGRNLEELQKNKNFKKWFLEARRSSGFVTQIKESDITEFIQKGLRNRKFRSDDKHVLALAEVSGARLLYTNDKKLKDDFTNPNIISNPNGAVYTTQLSDGEINQAHIDLLNRNHCKISV